MSDYIPPNYNNLVFNFSSSGYSSPTFNKLSFIFDPRRVDISSSLVGDVFRNNYLKQCDTYVLGYSNESIQVIQTNCVYTGLNDLKGFLRVVRFEDMYWYIKVSYPGDDFLNSLIKPLHVNEQSLIESTLKGISQNISEDLCVVATPYRTGYYDLDLIVKTIHRDVKDVFSVVKGLSDITFTDIMSYSKVSFAGTFDIVSDISILYRGILDLYSITKSYSLGNEYNLESNITPIHSQEELLLGYLKQSYSGSLDISSYLKQAKNSFLDVSSELISWAEQELLSLIKGFSFSDLDSEITLNYFKDFLSYLYSVQPIDLLGSIFGWAYDDLISATGYYEPAFDIISSINSVSPIDLNSSLKVVKSVNNISDLSSYLTNYYEGFLDSNLRVIVFEDLVSELNSSRNTSDLVSFITPNIVFVRSKISIDFLEFSELVSTINDTCFYSGYLDIFSSLDIVYSSDIKGIVIGIDDSNSSDLFSSINAYVNVSINTLDLYYRNLEPFRAPLSLVYNKEEPFYCLDTLDLLVTGDFVKIKHGSDDFTSSIVAELRSIDLMSTINPISNYFSDTSNVISNVIVLDLKNNVENFRKYVALTLNSYANSYYYFSGNKQAFRVNPNDHWVIKVLGYKYVKGNNSFEKRFVNTKYIFKLSDFSSIDEAVRNMIERVTSSFYEDLTSSINSVSDDFSLAISDIVSSIVVKRYRKSNKTLKGELRVVNKANIDLLSDIFGVNRSGVFDLYASLIVQEEYEDSDGIVNFNFVGTDDLTLTADQVNFNFV